MSSRRPQFHFILLLLAYYCSTHTTANGGNGITVRCFHDQASSLLQLKRSFHNPNLSSWQQGSDCCHWEVVGCDRASGRVITLDLSDRNLRSISGLSPALFNLTSLTNLSLSGNDFNHTSLPNSGFDLLTELLSLDLSHARFSGQIPIGIAHLENLLTLDLSGIRLYLQEPSFQTLVANLSNLRGLYLDSVGLLGSSEATWSAALANSVPLLQDISLSYCMLGGPIHHSFSRLHFLATINLEGCGISGQVPDFFAEFSLLRDLSLRYNDFEGQFPTKIFQLENLREVDVSSNPSLSVQLPDFPQRNNLESLNLLDTNFSGAIPADSFVHLKSLKSLGLSNIGSPNQATPSIANLTSLNTLWLSGSRIEKPMLSWIGRLKNLTDLMLQDYNLSGPIPSWIRNCTDLMSLQLNYCSLSGAIPAWIGNLTKLSDLDLSDNRLSGKIPNVLFNLPSLEALRLSSNELSGTLDDITDPLSSSLHSIDLSRNSFTGHIPKSLFDLTKLQDLWLDTNHFKGTVELSLLWKVKTLYSLDLSNNMLSVIDVEDGYPFPYLLDITELRLASCNLTKIPVALRYANEMSDLDLSNNRIDGVIPSWIWVNWKDTISYLNLSNNMFTSLENSPSAIHVSNLGTLDLSSNKLHGHIPRSICAQQHLWILDLSYNNFHGRVPSCLTQGSRLIMLKLRDNHFHGMLPENFGEGCMLQTIDLNHNRIEGKIPRSLSNCRSLEVLDIGNNQILDSFPYWLGPVFGFSS